MCPEWELLIPPRCTHTQNWRMFHFKMASAKTEHDCDHGQDKEIGCRATPPKTFEHCEMSCGHQDTVHTLPVSDGWFQANEHLFCFSVLLPQVCVSLCTLCFQGPTGNVGAPGLPGSAGAKV